MPPIQLLLTRRLLLAKQLLTETTLPITEVAFASGFSSLRRFNDAFNTRYGMPPTRLRRKAAEGAVAIAERPDIDAAALLSTAVRLDRRARVSGGARAQRRRARHRQLVCADGAARQREGLDPGDAVEQEARADGRVHAQPDAGAAGAAQPRARAVRSRRAARRDREALGRIRAWLRREGATPACACLVPSTDSRWGCARSSASRSP